MAQLFPYKTSQVNEAIDTIEAQTGKTWTDIEFRRLIWKELKSFMFSSKDLNITSEDRKALFYGDKSVANLVKEFKLTPEGARNRFIQKLRVKGAKVVGMPDLVLLNASAAERTDEQEVVKHFVDLFTSLNQETRDLGEKLVQYAFAVGGIQEALQYVKYIPTAYLATTNFGTKLKELTDLLNSDKGIDVNRYIKQFYQHNPSKARKHSVENIGNIATEGIKFNTTKDKVGHLTYVKDNVETYVDYLSVRDNKKGSWVLLKLTQQEGHNLVYNPIAVLGGHGKDYTSYNEYNYNEDNVQSTIPSNNPKATTKVETKIIPTTSTENSIPNPLVYEVKAQKYINPTIGTGELAAKFAMSQLETDRYKALAPIFTNNTNLLTKKFEVIIDNDLHHISKEGTRVEDKGLYLNGKVYINPKRINENSETLYGRKLTSEDLENTLMHEVTHAYTVELYKLYQSGQEHELLTPKVKKSFERIQSLFNIGYNQLSDIDKAKVQKMRDSQYKDGSLNSDDIRELYGFVNPKEFMSEVLTKKEFQLKLNGMSAGGTKSIWEQITKFLQDIYNEFVSTLGFKVEQNSVLAHTLMETMNLIDSTQEETKEITKETENSEPNISEIQNKELSLNTTVGEYFKQLSKEQRIILREMMSQKTIEFKCS